VADTLKSIGAAKDYATPTAWEAATYGGVGAGDNAVGQVYGTVSDNSVMNDTTPGTVILEGVPGGIHDGTPGTGAELTSAVNNEIVDVNGVDNFTIRNLEFDQQGANVFTAAARYIGGATGGEFHGNLLYGKAANRSNPCSLFSIGGGATAAEVHDNILFDAANSGTGTLSVMLFTNGGTTLVYNNTITDADASNAAATCYGIELNDDADHTYKNNLVTDIRASGGGTDECYSDSAPANATTGNNLSDDATSPDAAFRNKSITFVNAGADDYHLAAGDTDAIDAGVGPGADANVSTSDIDGDARAGATCDIGADERVAAVAPTDGVARMIFLTGEVA
jgi:hypothetical protein